MVLEKEDVHLFYEVIGEGKPIVFLHGNGEDHQYFLHQIPYFTKQKRKVILIDMRGHGASTFGNQTLCFALFAQDLKDLLDHLKLQPVDLVGFSDGANTAMIFAIHYPNYVDHLVLNAGNRNPWGMKCSVLLDVWKGYWQETDMQKKQILALMAKQPNITKKQLRTIQASTLVLSGEYDMIKASHTKTIAQLIPHAQEVILAGCDHFAAWKAYAQWNEIVGKFLEGEEYGRTTDGL